MPEMYLPIVVNIVRYEYFSFMFVCFFALSIKNQSLHISPVGRTRRQNVFFKPQLEGWWLVFQLGRYTIKYNAIHNIQSLAVLLMQFPSSRQDENLLNYRIKG
uniref:Uncharacterized protein n=1 Tax=Cacopsylla melanoneura TaxID=428564 RepID=A0A8D8TLC2_9HEMI